MWSRRPKPEIVLPENWKLLKPARLIPTFNLYELQEVEEFTRADLYGQKTILVFLPGMWAPWARKLISQLDMLTDYLEKMGCQLVAVISQNQEQLQEYFESNPVKMGILADPAGHASLRFSIFDDNISEPLRISKPTVLAVNAESKIQAKFTGRHLSDRPNPQDIIEVTSLLTDLPRKRRWWNIFFVPAAKAYVNA
jgi:peroxiredoxin